MYNKALFEFELAQMRESYLRTDFFNFRDISKFSPEVFSLFHKTYTEEGYDISMAQDGVYHIGTNEESGLMYYLDTSSGLIFTYDGKCFYVTPNTCFSKEYDIFDAAYLRRYLAHPETRHQVLSIPGDGLVSGEITSLNYLGLEIKDIFSEPILEYTVSSREELDELLSEITTTLTKSKFFRKLWFRGQHKEYTFSRSQETIDTLGFPKQYTRMPSLAPSVGRIVNQDDYIRIRRNHLYWASAFRAWLLSQSKVYESDFGIGTPLFLELMQNLSSEKLKTFLDNYPYDIDDYFSFQDTDEMWASILAIQQYGGHTSMLDITDNIDVALFFSQSFLDRGTRKYEICQPKEDNVIYLLTGTRNSCTVDLAQNIFDYIQYSDQYPIPPRIANQCCGLLRGADMFSRNTYAYRIIAKIKITGSGIPTSKTVDEMFPGMDIDSLYKTYSYVVPRLADLYG